jgi:hypothetical protein
MHKLGPQRKGGLYCGLNCHILNLKINMCDTEDYLGSDFFMEDKSQLT